MHPRSVRDSIQQTVRYHGTGAAIYDATVRTINRVVYWKNVYCLVLEEQNPEPVLLRPSMRFVNMNEQSLLRYSSSNQHELPESFVRQAFGRGDECFAILDGDAIASYAWYSKHPTVVERGLRLRFAPEYVYRYKVFTVSSYRGQRLDAAGGALALSHYRTSGFRGFICCVLSNNFASLKACYRIGYRLCGSIRVLRIGGKSLIWHLGNCEQYGLALSAT